MPKSWAMKRSSSLSLKPSSKFPAQKRDEKQRSGSGSSSRKSPRIPSLWIE
jgi:hypothetical protein